MNSLPKKGALQLPTISTESASILESLTTALGVPRNVLASDDEISRVWQELPRLLDQIPSDMRNVLLARMCVAIATGLFDSAVNYIWNCTVIELQNKVKRFGIHVVPQITSKPFDESALRELKDADLLKLCLSLNLISEEGYFFLDQCRDTRNSFSAAHPPIGNIDDLEFRNFLNRCAKHAINVSVIAVGVDVQGLIKALKASRFSGVQKTEWCSRISSTHEAQRNLLLGMLHGIYCDPSSSEEIRSNCFELCQHFSGQFTDKLKSEMLDRHSNYKAENKVDRLGASATFFEKLQLLGLLDHVELHSMISNASQRLLSVHLDWNNFYNEPPFAERLLELSAQVEIPDTTKSEYVYSVIACGIGNRYGVSGAAFKSYEKMVKNFSPKEIAIIFLLLKSKNLISERISNHAGCRRKFKEMLNLLNAESVPVSAQTDYNWWLTN